MSVAEIEALFASPVLIIPDSVHSQSETPVRAIGRSDSGRMMFLVFTVRQKGGQRRIRPISARFMHAKEVAWYEKENPAR